MVAAAESFSQPGGGGVGIPGFAMIGALALAVTVANGVNTGVTNWTFNVADVPPGSTVPTGLVQTGSTPTWTFTPDRPGTYEVVITVTDGIVTVSDTRTFHVPESTGQIVPGFLETSAMDNYPLNAGHNARGWATAMEGWLRTLDVPLTTLTSGPVVLSSSNGFVEFNGAGNIAVTMPAASTSPIRRFYYFKNKTNHTNTITPAIGDTIDGGGALALTGTGAYAVLATDGVHNWNIISGEANSTTGGDATGPVTSMTVVGWENKPLHSSMAAPNNLDVPQYDTGTLKWKSVASSSITVGGVTPGTAGQIYITNGTPASAWTSLISVELTHGRLQAGGSGSDFKAIMGPLVSFETADAGIWFLPTATTPTSANVSLWSDAGNTFMNTGAGTGILGFTVAGSTYMGAFNAAQLRFYVGGSTAAAPIVIDWATSLQTQVGSGTNQTSLLIGNYNTGAASVIIQAGTGGITWRDGATQTTRGSIELTHGRATFGGSGSDFKACIGPDPTAETVAATLHLLPNATAPSGSNYALQADGSNLSINALGNVIAFQVGTSGMLWMNGGTGTVLNFTLPNYELAATAGAPVFFQDARTSDTLPNDMTFRPQQPFASATVNKNGGNFIVDMRAVSSGLGFGPFLKIKYNQGGGDVWPVSMGSYSSGGYGAIWFMTATPGTSNWSFLSDGSNTYFNAPSAVGNMYYGLGTTYVLNLNTTNLNLGATYSSPQYIFDLANTAIFHFGVSAATSATIQYDAKTSDVATNTLTMRAQYAFATATGTNRIPGYMIFDVGAPTNGLTGVANEGEFQWSRAGTVLQSFKFDNVNDIALWRLPNTLWEWEWVVGNGEMLLASNVWAAGGGSAWWISAQTTTVFMGGFVTSNSPLIFDFTTSTTPTINSGLLATQLSIGTAKGGASLILWAGASTVVATATSTSWTIGVGTGNNSLVGSLQLTWRNSSANFTIDTTTTDQSIHITATQTMTAPTPTLGRDIDIIIEAFGGGDVTLTINQHASEKINNVAAAYVIVVALGQVQGWKMRSNGTDWYIFPG